MNNGQYIFCNNCGTDLTATDRREAYRTVLSSEPIPHWDGPVTEATARPEPAEPHHFCGTICLVQFLDKHRAIRGT